jgi:hypothetical protein
LDCEYGEEDTNYTTSSTTTTTTTSPYPPDMVFVLTTDSESATWHPYYEETIPGIVKTGATLHWEVTGAVTTSADDNNPTFDFSTPGVKNIIVTSSDGASGISQIAFGNLGIITIDITRCTDLQALILILNPLLTYIDISQNVDLTDLVLAGNNILSIDTSGNISLTKLTIFNELNLSSLDISQSVLLEQLQITDCSQITEIDLSNNTELIRFWCYGTSVTSLDLSNNINLTLINCEDCLLTSIDLTGLSVLQAIDCHGNSLSTLDLSTNTNIVSVYCSYNNLTKTSVDDMLDDLVGFNKSGNSFYAINQTPAIVPDAGKVAALDAIWATVSV